VTYSGVGDLLYAAGAGNETLNAAAANGNILGFGNSSASANERLILGSGNDTLVAGAGANTITGGSGADVFWFVAKNTAGATDFITDFNSSDSVNFWGYSKAVTAESLIAAASTGPSGVTLTLSDNTKVVFTNLTSNSSLTGHLTYGY
jgi:Ca2+-binding RTX toxin-like protein